MVVKNMGFRMNCPSCKKEVTKLLPTGQPDSHYYKCGVCGIWKISKNYIELIEEAKEKS
jgi:hypothetical protein